MTKQIEPRIIDFSRVHSFDRDQISVSAQHEERDREHYQAILTAIRGGCPGIRPYVPGEVRTRRPLADLSEANGLALEHIRSIARRVKAQDGYGSQFVALTKPFHGYLGPNVDGVLDRVWREEKAPVMIIPKGEPVADDDSARPRVWKATDLEPAKPKTWLAKQRIPRAGVTVLVGDEGIGKSLLWVWIVGAVTTGKPLPEFGIPARDPQHVRLVLTEDDWSTEVLPRLELVGADLDFVTVIATTKDGAGAPVFPSDDMKLLYEDPVPALVIVDAWLDTVPGSLNVQTPQDARKALHPWKDVAVHTDAAVVLMTHTNRAKGTARDKYGITGELRKKARMALYAQRDEQGRLQVGPEKANGTAIVASTMFTIEDVQVRPGTDDDDGTVAQVKYIGDSDHKASELADSSTVGAEHQWLINHLAEGPRQGVIERAVEEGFKAYKIRLAAKDLKVKFERVGYPAISEWSLP